MSTTHHDEDQLAAPASLIARTNASNYRRSSPGRPAAAISPASSDTENSPAWKERHELSA
jgi:hypothetical protein